MYTHLHVCTLMYTQERVCIYTQARVCMYMHARVCMYMHARVCMLAVWVNWQIVKITFTTLLISQYYD